MTELPESEDLENTASHMETQKFTPSQMHGLLGAAGSAVTRELRRWSPPSVEQLQQMLPQYDVTSFIAHGGMGAVYRGTQKTLKRSVAIKVLPPEIEQGDLQFAERFKHEAQAMARLTHPNIVAVFDAGETPDGLLYFVMEFVEGTDVAQLIASEGLLGPQRAIEITLAVCEALAFAHEEGIIHRDIKPSNIMIDKRGRVKVADFGLAKSVNVESTLLTVTHMAMGTPDFIAPEAMIPGLKIDQRADLYAVGVMLYQMLTGTIPRGRFHMPSSVVPQINQRFDHIVDKAMQTDREHRYSTAIEIKTDVEKMMREASDHGMGADGKSRPLKQPFIIGMAAALLLGMGAFLLLHKKAGVVETSATRTIPARPPSYIPGRWVKVWQRPEDIPNAGTVTDGWTLMKPPFLSAHLPGSKGLNWGVRSRFLLGHGAPPPQLLLRDAKGTGYNVIPVWGHLRFRRNDPNYGNRNVELGKNALELPQPGEEITLEFIIIGQRLIARLNGQTFTMSLDPTAYPPQPGDAGLYQVDRNAFRNVEAINLDGLSEAEALKAAGIDLDSATTVAPTKSYSFPTGLWVNPFREASDLESGLIGSTWKDGWIIPDATSKGMITLSILNVYGRNWGVRARYRWQEKSVAILNLRRKPVTDKSYVTHDFVVTGEEANFRLTTTYRDGKPMTATTQGLPMPVKLSAGDEVLVEAFAIGNTLYGRVNGQTFQVSIDGALDKGAFLASTMLMSYRDIEFMNLDGLSEAAARKAAKLEK